MKCFKDSGRARVIEKKPMEEANAIIIPPVRVRAKRAAAMAIQQRARLKKIVPSEKRISRPTLLLVIPT